ncbi:MAG: hypothetical protein F6K22_18215 [Okeania sp. SIO2F4]|uniref:hypothetical protein n=1 Tax=Okeania sp. SIO2F4 TaxID=2607790 RepID=UPI00142CEE27|nr:hypothetical protein [Okeania sp. SIO2F4]NES04592.1 hypothetical protein [Okeania sp. SIO2F4]
MIIKNRWWCSRNGKGSIGSVGRWGDGEMGRWGDGEMGRWGVSEKLKNIYPHHYHAGLPKNQINPIRRNHEFFPRTPYSLLPTPSFPPEVYRTYTIYS